MKKTWIKIVSSLTLICTLIISGSFSVYAYENGIRVNVNTIETTYGYLIDHQRYYVPAGFTETTNIDNVEAHIHDMHDQSGAAVADNNIDHTYPLYLIATSTNTSIESAISRSSRAFCIDDLSQAMIDTNAGVNNSLNMMSILLGSNASLNYSIIDMDYGTLYDLGYRFYHKTSTMYNNNQYWLYTLARYKAPDEVDYNGSLTSSGTITGSVYDKTVSMFFKRYDFQVFNMTGLNNNKTYKYENGYISLDSFFNLTGYSIYEMHDVSIIQRGYYGSIQLAITGTDPYIVFCQTVEDATSWTTTYNSRQIAASYYMSSTDLSGIANTLTEIKDLLSDLQVQEIQNIYNNIENNYDVDVDLELNNYLDDYSDKFNSLDFEDPNINIPTNDVEKVGSFKIIFSNMMQTMNQSGIGILYFLPLVLLIIGVII